jgi:hypothetical protein
MNSPMTGAALRFRHNAPMRSWFVAALLVAGGAGCSGKTAETSEAEAGAAGVHEVGAAGAGGSGSDCSVCPSARDVVLCCDEYCGYLNTETNVCESSRAGSNVLTIVTAPEGALCSASSLCHNDVACPPTLPLDGSSCSGELHCTYCAPFSMPRMVACRDRVWQTVGPNPPCGFTIEP